jgi:predicted helicase
MLLAETGYKPGKDQRLSVYLTNSLEEPHPDTQTLFASWLSHEAEEANRVKRDCPVMVVIGNPPYAGESSNKSKWIMDLMEDYKKEPGGNEKLKEKNPKWINDDYVKFLRYGQYFIEKNKEGVLAFINPHGFLDNPTFRGMRWNLLKTYDKIYTIDLHGNSKKKEVCPDGSKDENVFDIQQGVSINLFIKTGKKKTKELGKLFHFDLLGKREMKYDMLSKNDLKTIQYKKLENVAPNYFFVQKDFEVQKNYDEGFSIVDLFRINSVGVVTARDAFCIQESKEKVRETIKEFLSLDNESARKRFDLGKDVRDWTVEFARNDLIKSGSNFDKIVKISYRPFDDRYTYYTGKSKGFHCMPRGEVMQHFLKGDNVALMTCRQTAIDTWEHVGITKLIADDSRVSNRTRERGYILPLYLYPDKDELNLGEGKAAARTPNLNMEIVAKFAERIGLSFEAESDKGTKAQSKLGFSPTSNGLESPSYFTPENLLDYIYAVLHSPNYRDKYKEFLKIDFPRIPLPENAEEFWKFVEKGCELRKLHLMESSDLDKPLTSYPVSGSNIVEKVLFKECDTGVSPVSGKVFINSTQYFDNVPEIAWNFYIGGYQPAQKWLKDRKSRTLSYDDIIHYQKIIVALKRTAEIMEEINELRKVLMGAP